MGGNASKSDGTDAVHAVEDAFQRGFGDEAFQSGFTNDEINAFLQRHPSVLSNRSRRTTQQGPVIDPFLFGIDAKSTQSSYEDYKHQQQLMDQRQRAQAQPNSLPNPSRTSAKAPSYSARRRERNRAPVDPFRFMDGSQSDSSNSSSDSEDDRQSVRSEDTRATTLRKRRANGEANGHHANGNGTTSRAGSQLPPIFTSEFAWNFNGEAGTPMSAPPAQTTNGTRGGRMLPPAPDTFSAKGNTHHEQGAQFSMLNGPTKQSFWFDETASFGFHAMQYAEDGDDTASQRQRRVSGSKPANPNSALTVSNLARTHGIPVGPQTSEVTYGFFSGNNTNPNARRRQFNDAASMRSARSVRSRTTMIIHPPDGANNFNAYRAPRLGRRLSNASIARSVGGYAYQGSLYYGALGEEDQERANEEVAAQRRQSQQALATTDVPEEDPFFFMENYNVVSPPGTVYPATTSPQFPQGPGATNATPEDGGAGATRTTPSGQLERTDSTLSAYGGLPAVYSVRDVRRCGSRTALRSANTSAANIPRPPRAEASDEAAPKQQQAQAKKEKRSKRPHMERQASMLSVMDQSMGWMPAAYSDSSEDDDSENESGREEDGEAGHRRGGGGGGAGGNGGGATPEAEGEGGINNCKDYFEYDEEYVDREALMEVLGLKLNTPPANENGGAGDASQPRAQEAGENESLQRARESATPGKDHDDAKQESENDPQEPPSSTRRAVTPAPTNSVVSGQRATTAPSVHKVGGCGDGAGERASNEGRATAATVNHAVAGHLFRGPVVQAARFPVGRGTPLPAPGRPNGRPVMQRPPHLRNGTGAVAAPPPPPNADNVAPTEEPQQQPQEQQVPPPLTDVVADAPSPQPPSDVGGISPTATEERQEERQEAAQPEARESDEQWPLSPQHMPNGGGGDGGEGQNAAPDGDVSLSPNTAARLAEEKAQQPPPLPLPQTVPQPDADNSPQKNSQTIRGSAKRRILEATASSSAAAANGEHENGEDANAYPVSPMVRGGGDDDTDARRMEMSQNRRPSSTTSSVDGVTLDVQARYEAAHNIRLLMYENGNMVDPASPMAQMMMMNNAAAAAAAANMNMQMHMNGVARPQSPQMQTTQQDRSWFLYVQNEIGWVDSPCLTPDERGLTPPATNVPSPMAGAGAAAYNPMSPHGFMASPKANGAHDAANQPNQVNGTVPMAPMPMRPPGQPTARPRMLPQVRRNNPVPSTGQPTVTAATPLNVATYQGQRGQQTTMFW